MYLFEVIINEGKHGVYEFMDPNLINSTGNKKVETQTYITNCLHTRGENIFAPYINK